MKGISLRAVLLFDWRLCLWHSSGGMLLGIFFTCDAGSQACKPKPRSNGATFILSEEVKGNDVLDSEGG